MTCLKPLLSKHQIFVTMPKKTASLGFSLDSIEFIHLKALNSFLKQPIFEIRQVTLEQLAELE